VNRIALAALAATMLVTPAAAADVSGNWTFVGEVVGNAINMKCAFRQEAGKIAATCTHQGLPTGPTTVDVSGDQVTFSHQVDNGNAYDLTFTGTLDAAGNSMKGDIAVAGVSGTFSGTRDEPKALAPPDSPKIDISGNWTFVGDVVGNPINMKCAFKQDAAAITGTCTHEGHPGSPTTGGVEGDKVTFRHQVEAGGQVYDLTFAGTLDAAGLSMKGEVPVEGVTGTFSGTKDKEQ